MNLQKNMVRQEIERMVINYYVLKLISEDQSAAICDFLERTIGGETMPQPGKHRGRSVIPFPTSYNGPELDLDTDIETEQKAQEENGENEKTEETYAPYGDPLPEGMEDLRETLQRDGLVLICYEKHLSREGTFYNVLWAQSNINQHRRSTASSGFIRSEDICHALPLDDSGPNSLWYKYRDKATLLYTVKVAPKNVLEGPFSDFIAYVQSLKDMGLKNNFDYLFSFAAEKRGRVFLKNKELIDLNLPSRVIYKLNDRGIHTVQSLKKMTVQELYGIRSLGPITLGETLTLLKKQGITLQEEKEEGLA
jgi:hypothetical protein